MIITIVVIIIIIISSSSLIVVNIIIIINVIFTPSSASSSPLHNGIHHLHITTIKATIQNVAKYYHGEQVSRAQETRERERDETEGSTTPMGEDDSDTTVTTDDKKHAVVCCILTVNAPRWIAK